MKRSFIMGIGMSFRCVVSLPLHTGLGLGALTQAVLERLDLLSDAWCMLLGVTPAHARPVAAMTQGQSLEGHAAARGISVGAVPVSSVVQVVPPANGPAAMSDFDVVGPGRIHLATASAASALTMPWRE